MEETLTITSLCFESGWVILGDNSGSVKVYNQMTGDLLMILAPEKKVESDKKSSFNLAHRVNHLLRLGRFVFSAHQDGQLNVFDMYRTVMGPVFHFQSRDKAMKSFLLDWKEACLVVKVQKEREGSTLVKKVYPPDMLLWNPQFLSLRSQVFRD